MGNAPLAAVLRHIRRAAAGPADQQPADRQLLERFALHRDEAAFAALLGRHGPMVLGVCRGILGDAHAAEDAFQATFLVLARNAGSIHRRDSVGGWLYQVARRAALRARAGAARRQLLEKRAEPMPSADPWLDLSLRELREAVHEELGRLPERYRAPLVLCYLEGKTKEEAARLLDWSPGAVKGRLERGRKQLRTRLTRRGLALPAGVFASLLAHDLALAQVPAGLVASTVKAALAVVGGQGLISVSAEVAALVQGVTRSMALKFKIVTALVLVVFGMAGVGALGYPAWAARQGDPPKQPAPDAPKDAPKAPAPAKEVPGETLHYSGKVTDKDTGKPIAGATVTVRRSLLGDPELKEQNPIMEETKHTTDAEGKYSFTIPPEQTSKRYLYIELDVEHPDYAPQKGFGYALSMIRKNEKLGGRPFFEGVELRKGQSITGTVQIPEGQPAAGVKVLAYSVTDRRSQGNFEYGSFAETRTDAQGRFRLALTTPGFAVYWLLPEQYVPETHVLKGNKRGELGTLTMKPGIRLRGKVLDAKGQPLAGVNVNAESQQRNEDITEPVADNINRSAVTDVKGEFAMNPLPPGVYKVQPDIHMRDGSLDRKDRKQRPVPAVFIGMRVTLKDGAEPEPIEVRATPHVIIEAQYVDSKGQPTRGHSCHVFGQLDKMPWFGEAKAGPDGKMVAYVPHGLERVQLNLMTNEHGALRWRRTKDGPLNNTHRVDLGTVNDDVMGIEVVRYTAPIVLVKVAAKDGQPLKDPAVTAVYGAGKRPYEGQLIAAKGRHSDVSFEKQEDGRFRSEQLFPDEETTVTAHADGYASQSVQVKLPEGATKEIEIVLEKAAAKAEDKKEEKK
jgi:RNA polymerase sigma factor (sigma-70 family)